MEAAAVEQVNPEAIPETYPIGTCPIGTETTEPWVPPTPQTEVDDNAMAWKNLHDWAMDGDIANRKDREMRMQKILFE